MIETKITKMLGIEYPIIAAPMFLVSNPELVAAVSNAGGLGTMPALNYRKAEEFEDGLKQIKDLTDKPFGINIIVNKSNILQDKHLELCMKYNVKMIVTSLGSPKNVIMAANGTETKVFCDVVDLKYALKVEEMGADAVVAVGAGAGGHAGTTVNSVLVPYLAKNLKIPVIAAGGIADGRTMLSAMALGSQGVYMGTRFIASKEVSVNEDYKKTIVECKPEDIIYTAKVTGTHANFIKTPYLEAIGTELSVFEKFFSKNKFTKKWFKMLKGYKAMKQMETSAGKTKKAWKDVWSAGQTVGLIDNILPANEIIKNIVEEYEKCKVELP
jgi:nitronate monooxygenase